MLTSTVLICQICGDRARGMNFNVITCMSCKAFFRRHALRSEKSFSCPLNSNCLINKQSRGACTACRLKKCFAFGMNPDLIRSPYKKKLKAVIKLPEMQPRSLLIRDRSALSTDEWILLSNVLNTYDEQNLAVRTQNQLSENSLLPAKLRFKQLNTLKLIGSFYTAIQPCLQRSPYFFCLPVDIRKFIIQNNIPGTGSFNTCIAVYEADCFSNEMYLTQCYEIYGKEYVQENRRIVIQMESNLSLLKILIMILTFSTNCSVVSYDSSVPVLQINVPYLLSIQNIFITMFWKFLVYQYGDEDAVRHLVRVVKNYLDILNRMDANVSRQHWNMVDNITEKMTHSLELVHPNNGL